MLKPLQKHVPALSFLLLLVLVVALFLHLPTVRLFSIIIIIFGIGTTILFTIQGNWETKQNEELTKAQFARNITIDLLGLALMMGAAMWLGRMAGGYAGQVWGMVAGIVAGMAVGFGAALVVGKVWGRVSDRLRAIA